MTRPPLLIVGAGPSGLGLASELAKHARVTLLDRIPVPGGTAGWTRAGVRRLSDHLHHQGVDLRLGQAAIRWDGQTLLVATAAGFDRLPGGHLFFAGGLRPATVADLDIDGDRPAGVLAATVVEHLLHTGVRLWERAVVLGDGPWARPVAAMCREVGTSVLAVTATGNWGDRQIIPADRYSVVGRTRVTALRCHTAGTSSDIACDAIVLAADPRPNRSIEGALSEGASGVTFHQPTAPEGFDQRVEAARSAARSWMSTPGGVL